MGYNDKLKRHLPSKKFNKVLFTSVLFGVRKWGTVLPNWISLFKNTPHTKKPYDQSPDFNPPAKIGPSLNNHRVQ